MDREKLEVTVEGMRTGSRNIDHMRSEVRVFISQLLGLIPAGVHLTEWEEVFLFSSPKCEWRIKRSVRAVPLTANTIVQCRVLQYGQMVPAYSNFSCSDDPDGLYAGCAFHTDTAEDVFDGLNVLLEGFLVLYPEIRKNAQPYMRAAKRKFK